MNILDLVPISRENYKILEKEVENTTRNCLSLIQAVLKLTITILPKSFNILR